MKLLTILLAGSLLTTGLVINAEAQILNRLKKKAQEAAQKKVEEKLAEQVQQLAEQMVEKSWNSVFGDLNTDSLSGDLSFLMNSNVTTEDAYSFDTVVRMEIETTGSDRASDPPMLMDMHFNKDQMYTGSRFYSEEMDAEEGELFIIYDLKNSAMLMLMSSDKEKFSFAYDWKQAANIADSLGATSNTPQQEAMDDWQQYTEIGQKTILGYTCEGYRSETDQQEVELWVSREVEFGMNSLFQAHANAKQMRGKVPANYPQGMIMEMKSSDLASGDITTMKVTDIQENARINYAVADYPRMSLAGKTTQN